MVYNDYFQKRFHISTDDQTTYTNGSTSDEIKYYPGGWDSNTYSRGPNTYSRGPNTYSRGPNTYGGWSPPSEREFFTESIDSLKERLRNMKHQLDVQEICSFSLREEKAKLIDIIEKMISIFKELIETSSDEFLETLDVATKYTQILKLFEEVKNGNGF